MHGMLRKEYKGDSQQNIPPFSSISAHIIAKRGGSEFQAHVTEIQCAMDIYPPHSSLYIYVVRLCGKREAGSRGVIDDTAILAHVSIRACSLTRTSA